MTFPDSDAEALLDAWERAARLMLNRVGWARQVTRIRRLPGSAMLFISAPGDALHAATEVNEWAWSEAERELAGQATAAVDAAAEALVAHILKEHARPTEALKPAKEPACVLIAGHRGKSSVAALLTAILRGRRAAPTVAEVTRETIARRGLPVTQSLATIVTSTHDEHAGEWPAQELRAIAEVLLVAGHVTPRLVVNADERVLVDAVESEQRRDRIHAAIGYFSLDPANPVIVRHVAQGGTAAVWSKGDLVFRRGGKRTVVCPASAVPMTQGGLARYHIANALGAILLASAIGVPKPAIVQGLTGRNRRGTR